MDSGLAGWEHGWPGCGDAAAAMAMAMAIAMAFSSGSLGFSIF